MSSENPELGNGASNSAPDQPPADVPATPAKEPIGDGITARENIPRETLSNTSDSPPKLEPTPEPDRTMIQNVISAARNAFSTAPTKETQWGEPCCKREQAKHFWRIGYHLDSSENPIGIVWDRAVRIQHMSDEERALFEKIEKDAMRVRAAFRRYSQESADLFEKLKTAATIGLCGPDPDVAFAKSYYKSFENEVPVAATKVRKKFLQGTLIWSTTVLILAAAVYVMLLAMHTTVFSDPQSLLSDCYASAATLPDQDTADSSLVIGKKSCKTFPTSWGLGILNTFFPDGINRGDAEPTEAAKSQTDSIAKASNLAMAFALSIVGCSIGIAVMAYIRNRQITYESFHKIYQYGMSPGRYLFFVCLLALVVLILVSSNVVIVGIGGITLNEVGERHWLGILVGLLCGVSEPLIATMVTNRIRPAEEFGSSTTKDG